MGSRSNTIIVRRDENGNQLEAAKCLYCQSGYDRGSNVSIALAFYDDGRYFANLPKEQQDIIGMQCFEYNPNLHKLDEAKWFGYDLHGTADVFLLQNGKDKFGCVVAASDHLIWLHERQHYVVDEKNREFVLPNPIPIQKNDDSIVIEGKTYVRDKAIGKYNEYYLVSLEDYAALHNVEKIPQIISEFVKNENIQMITPTQFDEFHKADFIAQSVNNIDNQEKTLRLENTLLSKYSSYVENEKTDFYNNQRKFDTRESSQFIDKEKLKEYPLDEDLLKALNINNLNEVETNENSVSNARKRR